MSSYKRNCILFFVLLLCGSAWAQDSTAVRVGWTGFSPDGKLAVVTINHLTFRKQEVQATAARILIYSTADGKQLAALDAHAGSINSIAFHPTLPRVLTCANDGTSKVWDYTTGALVMTLDKNTDYVVAKGAFNKSGSLMATSSFGRVRIWDAASGKLRQTLPHDHWSVNDFEFSEDDRYLETLPDFRTRYLAEQAGMVFDARSMIWELSTGRFLKVRRKLQYLDTLQGVHPYRAFSPDKHEYKGRELYQIAHTESNQYDRCDCGSYKVTYIGDQVIVWDATTFAQKGIYSFSTIESGSMPEQLLGYGCQYIVTTGKVISLPTLQKMPPPSTPYGFTRLNEMGLASVALRVSAVGNRALYYAYEMYDAVADLDQTVRIIELPGGKELFSIPVH